VKDSATLKPLLIGLPAYSFYHKPTKLRLLSTSEQQENPSFIQLNPNDKSSNYDVLSKYLPLLKTQC